MKTFTWNSLGAVWLLAAAVMLGGPKGCDDDPAEEDAEAAVEAPPAAEEPTPAPSEEREKGDTETTVDDGAGKPTGDGGGEPEATELAGTWSSASCGARTYAREVILLDGGTFVRLDLVSPCPPDAKCVWAGIIGYRGDWTHDGTAIALSGEQRLGSGGGDAAGPGPRKLVVQADPPRLLNPLASGTCEYERAEDRNVSSYLKMSPAE